jgi:hypothetical protein
MKIFGSNPVGSEIDFRVESVTRTVLNTVSKEDFYAEIYQDLDNGNRVCETQRFIKRGK